MRHDYDAVVVGARVAGAPTAMLLARRGHHVLLIDRVKMPSDTMSTHAILRTGVLQLTRWEIIGRVVAGAPPIRNVTLGFGEERIQFGLKDDYGIEALYAPRRYNLDSALVDAAVDEGVEFEAGTRLVDLHRDEVGRVDGVIVAGPSGPVSISTRHVIGADGMNSRVANLVGAIPYASHPPLNAVNYAYFDEVESDGFWFQFTPGVNAGLVPTNDGATCVFVGRPTDLHGAFRSDPEGEFRKLLRFAGQDLADRVDGGTRLTGFRGTAGLPGSIRQPWGPGWALVGDSGYVKDPISAHGISDSLRDAELCARAVDTALRNPGEESVAMTLYQNTRRSLSLEIFEQSKALAEYRWSAEEASARMREISSAVRRECHALTGLPEWPGVLRARAS
ncbi:MAG: NAD(P)/FAD-dependent oxidoreductase [Acidimicrobiia bacterium]